MKKQDNDELTKELYELLSKYPEEEIKYFQELINQTDLVMVGYQNSVVITEDGSDGKSE